MGAADTPDPGGADAARAADPEPVLPDPVRRRLDEIFGDVLPEVTRDEQADTAEAPPMAGDEWLRANRPPHHGG